VQAAPNWRATGALSVQYAAMPAGPRVLHQSGAGAATRSPRGVSWAPAKGRLANGGEALPARGVLCLICIVAALTVVILGVRLTFFNDEWYFLLQRPGLSADTVFAPHNGHLSASLVLIYKGLVEVFGLGSQLPFRLVLAGTVAALGLVVYALVAERAGRLVGLVAAAIIVFLGPAWEDLLWSVQIGFIGSLATGLGALLALEEDSPRRNVLACVLLVCSISLSDLGVPFLAAATVAVGLRRRPAQLWIAALPAALFGIWWIAYARDAPSYFSWTNVRGIPEYVLDSVASGFTSLVGLTQVLTGVWARRLLVAVVAVAVTAWVIRRGGLSRWILVFLAAALSFWVLVGANYIPGREPFASRYQLVHATFLILIVAELFRSVRLTPAQGAAFVAVALVVLGLNAKALHGGLNFMRAHSAYVKVDLGALEIARGKVAPTFQLFENVAHDPYLTGVTASRYFSESDAHGSPPSYSPEEISNAPAPQRQAADHVLAAAYRIQPEETRGSSLPSCRRLLGRIGLDAPEVEVPRGRLLLTNVGDRPQVVGLRRFAPPNRPTWIGFLKVGSTARVTIPRDPVSEPWRLTTSDPSTLRVCRP
jgi:hypothetical protein